MIQPGYDIGEPIGTTTLEPERKLHHLPSTSASKWLWLRFTVINILVAQMKLK
jgi:hypothetical protein